MRCNDSSRDEYAGRRSKVVLADMFPRRHDVPRNEAAITVHARSRCGRAAVAAVAFAAVIVPLSGWAQSGGRPGFIGDSACRSCHQPQADSYAHTAHHLTSQLPSPQAILGSFRQGANQFVIVPANNPASEPELLFRMELRDTQYRETAVTGYAPDLFERSATIDLVTGSGHRGQTFLTWQGDQLFELPVSSWTEGKQWINSPGYENGTADFTRPVHPGCMECHSGYLQPLSTDPGTNRFRRDTLVPGIPCETCHGPGATHAARHRGAADPLAPLAVEAIVNTAKLSRDRQVELCASCHNGIAREPLAPAFSYIPGEPLTMFFKPLDVPASEHPDVHGNQVGLLERSRCFQESPAMTCSTCHNTHAPERAAASYAERCLGCHASQACKVARKIGPQARTQCIECHMPVEQTNAIISHTGGKELHARMRNHWIRIYPESAAAKL